MVFVIMLLGFVVKTVLPVHNQTPSSATTPSAASQSTSIQSTGNQPVAGREKTDQPSPTPLSGGDGDKTMSYEEAKEVFGGKP